MSFVAALVDSLDYDHLAHDRASLKAITEECLRQGSLHSKLLDELCNRDLIDTEMVGELTRGFNNYRLSMFPRRLIKPEHLLGAGGMSFPVYLKNFHDLMTPPLVKEILEHDFHAFPYLPSEMISLEQVLAYFAKYHPDVDLEKVKQFRMEEIAQIYSKYYHDWKRDKYSQYDIQLNAYFGEPKVQ